MNATMRNFVRHMRRAFPRSPDAASPPKPAPLNCVSVVLSTIFGMLCGSDLRVCWDMRSSWSGQLQLITPGQASSDRQRCWPGRVKERPTRTADEGGKLARDAAISPLIEAGNVYLPHPQYAPWVTEFIEECAAFSKRRA